MRIAMMADLYMPHVSGVTTHISLVKRRLEQAGHEVFVFTFGNEGYEDAEPNVWRSPGIPVSTTGFSFGWSHTREIRRLIRTMDLLHVHHPFVSGQLAVRYAGALAIPVVFTNHTRYDLYAQYYVPAIPEILTTAFLQAYLSSFCRKCSLVIAPSEGLRTVLRDLGVKSPIEVIPNGIELDPFRLAPPEPLKDRLGLSEKETLGVYVGRLGPEKNLAFLLRSFRGAAAACPWVHLALIGEGPERDDLEDQVRQSGLARRVHFLGQIHYEELPSYLRAADFFVTASVSEVHPLTITESMAAGLPAVGIASPGVEDLIEHETNGLLADNDLAAFTAMLTRMAVDVDLRRRLGSGASATANRFGIDATVTQLLDRYQSLCQAVPIRRVPPRRRTRSRGEPHP
jgi:1,2-diacylglycerol 3-alpha-glucosyltransferase